MTRSVEMTNRDKLRQGVARALCRADAAWCAGRDAGAKKATSFLVGDPLNGVPLRNPTANEIATAIRLLLPPETRP